MHSRNRTLPVVAVLLAVTGLTLVACGGGGEKTYDAGTPAATGQAPDCSVVPLDLARKTLGFEKLEGPIAEPMTSSAGWVCTFSQPGTGVESVQQVQFTGNATPESFANQQDRFEAHNNEVNEIKGWGDEAFATSVYSFSTINNFAVRKGKVSVHITSTAEYDNIKKLMKEVLEKV